MTDSLGSTDSGDQHIGLTWVAKPAACFNDVINSSDISGITYDAISGSPGPSAETQPESDHHQCHNGLHVGHFMVPHGQNKHRIQ